MRAKLKVHPIACIYRGRAEYYIGAMCMPYALCTLVDHINYTYMYMYISCMLYSDVHIDRGDIQIMNEELNQCLNSIPGFISEFERQRHSVSLNVIEQL